MRPHSCGRAHELSTLSVLSPSCPSYYLQRLTLRTAVCATSLLVVAGLLRKARLATSAVTVATAVAARVWVRPTSLSS